MGQSAKSAPGIGADFAALDEIDFVEAPEIRGEVHARAANEAAVHERALRLGFFIAASCEKCWAAARDDWSEDLP